jgi:hypothetical protein
VFTSERDAPFTSAGFARRDRWKGGSPIEGTTPLQAHLGHKNNRPEARSTQRSPTRLER